MILLQKPARCELCGKCDLGMVIDELGRIRCRKGPCKKRKSK